ncbi:LCP family protein [Actinomycetospora lutea]|uniref:LCP family glycopolymer transferase n=1 Tax=Actinomycetospora lutea TaxID=663604 RepID=UPI0023665E9D|nr:LCP family protein [Actinomycetospora lutea]MDD7940636.1 LCP family protein [Actinomycetospora lutea]
MTDDRAGDPVRGSRPATTGSDAARSSALSGTASAPFRIPVATPVADRRPTMVRLTRRSGPRLGLRPPGAALVTAPTPAPAGRTPPATPSSGIPSPAAAPAPSTRAPVDAVTLPAGRVPARAVPGEPARPAAVELVEPAEPPTDAVPEPPAAEPPAPRAVLPLTVTSTPPDPTPPGPATPDPTPPDPTPPDPATPDDPPASVPASSPSPPAEERRHPAAEARVGEADYAATSAVLASAGARLATWRRGWTGPRVLRLMTATCAVLVVVVCGLGWGAASWVEAAVRQIGALDPNSPAIQNAAAQAGDQNFLVVGSDSRAGAPPSEDAGDTAEVPGARTDTIMIVHVPEDRSGVTVVSFPRDLEITRPACERWDPVTGAYSPQMLPRAPRVKLNSAYAAGGPRCVTRAVQELSGLAINRFLGVDFQGFQGMVDSVRGVPICVERPVRDSVLGPIITQAGPTVLTGQQALDYVRARHVEGDPSSDYGRIQRQQRFLGALLRSVLSAGTVLDPGRLNGLVEAVSRSTFGENIGSDQLLTLTQSLGSLDPNSVAFVTVPTTGIANDRGNEVLRPAEERAMFTAIIEGRPLPGAPGAPAAPAPAPVDVRLVDGRSPADGDGGDGGDGDEESEDGGSSSDPSAASIAERLRGAGFGVVTDDSGSSPDGRGTSIRYSPDQSVAAQVLAAAVPGAILEPTASGNGTLTLVLGDDFDGRVRSGPGSADGAPAAPVNPTITAADASCA